MPLAVTAGLAVGTILLLIVPDCLSHQVSAAEQMSMSAAHLSNVDGSTCACPPRPLLEVPVALG